MCLRNPACTYCQLRGMSDSYMKERQASDDPDRIIVTLKYPDIEPLLVPTLQNTFLAFCFIIDRL
jgi:hypothetical protein